MPDLGSSSNAKVAALRDWLAHRERVALEEYLDGFSGQVFAGTELDKGELFKHLLDFKSELSSAEAEFLRSRLSTGRLAFYRGRRTPEQYAANLVCGWVVEDVLKSALSAQGARIDDTGDDREREFLQAPSAHPDWAFGGAPLELYVDFLGTWRRQGFIDLKEGKFRRLDAGAEAVLCYDLRRSEWFVINRDAMRVLCPDGVPSRVNMAMDGKRTYMVPTPEWPVAARWPDSSDSYRSLEGVRGPFDELVFI